MTGRVVVVGSLNMDVAVRTARLPRPGETLLGTSMVRSGGGKGANQAVAAARAGGARTTMIGAVGTDADGDDLVAALDREDIDTTAIQRSMDHPTGMALITVDDAAENTIVVVAGANQHLAISSAHHRALGAADVMVAQLETPQSVIVTAVSHLRPEARLVLNAAPSAQIDPELRRRIDLLVVNEHEALDLAGESDLDTALVALADLYPAVLVTLGARGARLLATDGLDVHVAAPSVTPVDTVGAGDTFCGVFAAALADGVDNLTSVQRACAAASLAIQGAGAQASIPTRDDTLAQTRAVYG
ncbi:MAG: ribokinase [Actinomycetota bacterium]|nr:ribokinase [Actinomycetota bacterium]